MQKAYSIVILGLLISMLTACGNDEPNNESTSIMIMYNRAVNTDNNDVTFSQSNCQFVLRNSGSLSMQAHMILKLDNSNTVEFSTDFMPLTASGDEMSSKPPPSFWMDSVTDELFAIEVSDAEASSATVMSSHALVSDSLR